MSVSKNILQYSNIARDWIALIATIVGGALGLMQYLSNSQSERTKETLTFIQRFNENPALVNQNNLKKKMAEIAPDLMKEQLIGDEKASKYLQNVVDKNDLEIPIDYIVDLHEQVYACVTSDLCDHDVAVRFLGKPANDFLRSWGHYIRKIKEQDASFADGLIYFAGEYKNK
jgi:hypothetical protein